MPETKMDCKHPGYLIKDGELRCAVCGDPSPRARLVDNQIVPIEPVIECPHCHGHLDRRGQPVLPVIEDKVAARGQDKGVDWPSESRRARRR